MNPEDSVLPINLLDFLSVSLVLHQTVPYLPVSGLVNLAATSKAFYELVFNTPNVFRYLDLSTSKVNILSTLNDAEDVTSRFRLIDENITEDDYYAAPLRRAFSVLKRKNVLQDVQTLILDGLSVTAELVREIICDESLNIRILSIRDVQYLNDKSLQQVLRYVVRAGRPAGTPRLKGLYYFGPKDSARAASPKLDIDGPSIGVTSTAGAQLGAQWNHRSEQALSSELAFDGDGGDWYRASGKLISKPLISDWASTVRACCEIIAFDAVVCKGLRHDPRRRHHSELTIGQSIIHPEVSICKVLFYILN